MYAIVEQTAKQATIEVQTAAGPYPVIVTQKAFGSRPVLKDGVQVSDAEGNPQFELYELTWAETFQGVAAQVQASLGAPV